MTPRLQNNLTSADDRRIPVALLILAMPIIASMVSRTIMSFIDFIMVTQLGTEAQAAILPSGMVLFCILSAAMGILSAVSTYVSQSLGRKQWADCSSYAWQGVYLGLGAGLVLLPMWWMLPVLFGLAGHEPAVQQMENDYAQIGVLGFAPAMVGMALTNFYNGVHRPMIAFMAALIGNLFNIAGNYALIYGHWGFEPMGVAGASWSTQISTLLQALILIGWMFVPFYRRQYQTLKTFRPHLARMGRLLWLGAPAGFQFATDIIAFTLFTVSLVGQYGTVQLAAHNLAFKFMEISFMPTVGLGVAVTAMVGKAIGAGRPDQARRIVRWGTFYGMSYMGLIALGYVVIHVLVSLHGPAAFRSWLTQDVQVISWASKLLLFCAVFQVFDAVTIIHVGGLRGAGDNHVPAALSLSLALSVFLTGGYLMTRLFPAWGIFGPWSAATAYICLLGVVFWARWQWGPWEKIRLHHDNLPDTDGSNAADPAVAAAETPPTL